MNTSLTISTLQELLNYDACKFASAELQLKNSLPGWIKKANSVELKMVMQQYLAFVEQHIQKMESFFREEQISAFKVPNRMMQALINETNEMFVRCVQMDISDVCLLACLQVINHLKISNCGTAASFANTLGKEKTAAVFHEAEINEKYIDNHLSQLAEQEINRKAKVPIVLARYTRG